jgi:hypothetical protein
LIIFRSHFVKKIWRKMVVESSQNAEMPSSLRFVFHDQVPGKKASLDHLGINSGDDFWQTIDTAKQR